MPSLLPPRALLSLPWGRPLAAVAALAALTSCAVVAAAAGCSATSDKGPADDLGPDGGGNGPDGFHPSLDTGGGGLDVSGLDVGEGGVAPPAGDPKTCAEAELSKSYIGCDYWPTVVANNVWSTFDFAVVVANAGDVAADVTVTGPAGFSTTASVPPNGLTKVYLPWQRELKGADANECGAAVALTQTIRADKGAYHLVASSPVTVYQFNALEYQGKGGPPGKDWSSCPGNSACPTTFTPVGCFSFTNDASLLLPSTAMTGNYRVTAYHGWSIDAAALDVAGAYFAITATADGTNVTVKLAGGGGTLAGGGLPAVPAGGTTTFTMNAGDVVELVGAAKTAVDLGGSLVKADKPVQVISGVPCMQVPIGQQACDHLEQSVLPAETLGKHYFVAVATAPHGDTVGQGVRIYGNVDGTKLTYAPTVPAGAPLTINAGQVVDLGVVGADFEVTGDHEFAVSTFMLGGALLDPSAAIGKQEGDPSQSQAIAVEQYRKKYIFLAPDDYDISYVDIVAPDGDAITLDGAPAGGTPKPISGGYAITRVKLGAGAAGGAHVITGTKPFGVQVIGYGLYTSYQYPGGLDLHSIAPPPVK